MKVKITGFDLNYDTLKELGREIWLMVGDKVIEVEVEDEDELDEILDDEMEKMTNGVSLGWVGQGGWEYEVVEEKN